ncbi:MAG: hypothetical protein M3N04_03570, partial [Actinomycetota bacterium]|nr:hypothetical protein [Actinomycetota bacterium]
MLGAVKAAVGAGRALDLTKARSGVGERRRQRGQLPGARLRAVEDLATVVESDAHPARAEPVADGRRDRAHERAAVERVLERRTEPPQELVAADALAAGEA